MSSGSPYGDASIANDIQRSLGSEDACLTALGGSAEAEGLGSRLAGDFYCERENVVRGLSLACSDVMGLSQTYEELKQAAASWNPSRDFDSMHAAPVLTEETRHNLQSTTLHLSNSLPITAGKALLRFLTQDVQARVNKVNPEKYTVRAEVNLDGLVFAVKIRIYQHEKASFVEFARRSGDSVAFSRFYHMVSAYLQGQSHGQTYLDAGRFRTVPLDADVAPLSPYDSITHLLDLAKNPYLLAEVASALCILAMQDGRVAAELSSTSCGLSMLQQLSEVDDFSVSLPTAALRSCMLA